MSSKNRLSLFALVPGTRGQALLELALILPVLLLLVFGIIEFGRVFHGYLVVTQAAREGARVGVVGGTDEEIGTTVEQVAASLDASRLQINVDPPEGMRVRGESLRVEVNYSVPLVVPLIAELAPNPFPLTAAATMRVE
ncbi:MAG: pilus assembly protein [Bacillota bacterium]|jgi:Flp pilus assembly protein TadG|nr:pilus assembly protein [Bacillota bacterium]